MISVKELEVRNECILPLNDATGAPLPGVHVALIGPGTKEYREAVSRWRKRNKRLNEADEEGYLKSNAQFLADLTVCFSGLEYEQFEGHEREMALSLYSNPRLGYIVSQVLNAVGDWGKFSQTS